MFPFLIQDIKELKLQCAYENLNKSRANAARDKKKSFKSFERSSNNRNILSGIYFPCLHVIRSTRTLQRIPHYLFEIENDKRETKQLLPEIKKSLKIVSESNLWRESLHIPWKDLFDSLKKRKIYAWKKIKLLVVSLNFRSTMWLAFLWREGLRTTSCVAILAEGHKKKLFLRN